MAQELAREREDTHVNQFLENERLIGRMGQSAKISSAKLRKQSANSYAGIQILHTESGDDLERMFADFTEDFQPRNSIESSLVREYVVYTWDLLRHQRIKIGLLQQHLPRAAFLILIPIVFPSGKNLDVTHGSYHTAKRLANDWMFDTNGRIQISLLLQEAGLDESAIVAKAFILAADDLERNERMINSAMVNRDRALKSLMKLRKSGAETLLVRADRAIAADLRQNIARAASPMETDDGK